MTMSQRLIKRFFDLLVATILLCLLWWVIMLAAFCARIDTGLPGIYRQKRVGKNGRLFTLFKIRSMRHNVIVSTSVTTDRDLRVSRFGWFIRKSKIDELPQLFNILKGDMSFVGPRPDVPGFADLLSGDDLLILSVRPGITGPATLYFKNEEQLLADQSNPEKYNREIIWPRKVQLNKEYIKNYSILVDARCILNTIGLVFFGELLF
jgi:lipopolysaccharide/colanic/teichoic acid biosynthesis glycosyltransferase